MIDFWAKTVGENEPGISVRDHCLNVGCVAEALIAGLPLHVQALLPEGAATLAALHDVGKISPGFQQLCEAWVEKWNFKMANFTREHALVSQVTLHRWFGRDEEMQAWAAAVGAHHGFGRDDWSIRDERDKFWADDRADLRDWLIKTAKFAPLPDQPPTGGSPVAWLLAGLVAFADWIGSTERFGTLPVFSAEREPPRLPATQRSLAKQVCTNLKIAQPLRVMPNLAFCEVWKFKPYAFQDKLVEAIDGPGVYVVEAPMGTGKTEAALYAAYRLIANGEASGIYFALPTQTTSNSIHKRIHPFLASLGMTDIEPCLIHSGSWLLNGDVPESTGTNGLNSDSAEDELKTGKPPRWKRWFISSRKALVAPIGVGTVDQALMGAIAVKFFFVRLFALAGKVVILDEVHSYDAYTGRLLAILVNTLRELGSTVIILSATLTIEQRRKFLPKDREPELRSGRDAWITAWRKDGSILRLSAGSGQTPRHVALRHASPDDQAIIEEAMWKAARGQCVLWICNTVDQAIETRKRLLCSWQEQDDVARPPVGLLHSRYPFFRRQQIEQKWLRRLGKGKGEPKVPNRWRRGCVLVSTQVVEQSVDIDADFMVTALAPTDMLFQRLGRLWRHEFRSAKQRGGAQAAEVVVLCPNLHGMDSTEILNALGTWRRIYDGFVLTRAWRQWASDEAPNTACIPDDIRPWLEATYRPYDRETESDLEELQDRFVKKMSRLEQAAMHFSNIDGESWGREDDEETARTRLQTMPTASLVLAREVVSFKPLRIRLMDGSETVVIDEHFKRNAKSALTSARAIHRNVVKIPEWWLDKAAPQSPDILPLSQHFHGSWHLAHMTEKVSGRDERKLEFYGGMPLGLDLAYHQHEGVILTKRPIPTFNDLDDEYDHLQLDD